MNASYVQLKKDMQNLGISAGDLLVVHSSFKSLGLVEGGAECVIAALKDVLGPEGTLVFPTFTYSTSYASSYFSNLETPSCVGYLSEFFRKTCADATFYVHIAQIRLTSSLAVSTIKMSRNLL